MVRQIQRHSDANRRAENVRDDMKTMRSQAEPREIVQVPTAMLRKSRRQIHSVRQNCEQPPKLTAVPKQNPILANHGEKVEENTTLLGKTGRAAILPGKPINQDDTPGKFHTLNGHDVSEISTMADFLSGRRNEAEEASAPFGFLK